MANTLQIKRGSGAPPDGALQDGELAYDKTSRLLYIGKLDEGVLTSVKFDYLGKEEILTNPEIQEVLKGKDGAKGADGTSQYTYVRYSHYADGNSMTNEPWPNTKYIGIAVTTSETAPSDYTDYSWSLIKGDKGTDGQSQYTHIKYSANANGLPGYSEPDASTKYIGIAVTTSATPPVNYADYTWSLIKGDKGEQGSDGQDGIPGPPGEDGESTYYVQIVSENGLLFKNGVIETILSAVVYQGEQDVTNTLDANQFRWTRVSSDPESDALWNSANASGKKTIVISTEDVYQRATFFCDIMEV